MASENKTVDDIVKRVRSEATTEKFSAVGNAGTVRKVAQEMLNTSMQELTAIMQDFNAVKRESMHYLSQGIDCFTVFAGPWLVIFDNSKESEVKDVTKSEVVE